MKQLMIWFSVGMLFLTSCGTTHYITPSVKLITENAGEITLRTSGISNEKYNAIAEAEKNAIREVLFYGIAGSQQKEPLVAEGEAQAKQAHADYFKKLFDKGLYKSFVTSSIPTTEDPIRIKGKKVMTVDVTIHIKALRQDLERNHIIRKFGY